MTLALAAAHAAAAHHNHPGLAGIGLLLVFVGAFWPRKRGSK